MVKKQNLIISFIFIILFTNSCTNYKNELFIFLPTQNEGWIGKGKPEFYSKTQLYDYIDGGAEIFFKYGFDSLIVQEYCFRNKSIILEIYKMASSKSAFGIYSYNRNSRFAAVSIGNEGIDEGSRIIFWQDRYYVIIQTFDSPQKIKTPLISLAKTVSAKIKKMTKNTREFLLNKSKNRHSM